MPMKNPPHPGQLVLRGVSNPADKRGEAYHGVICSLVNAPVVRENRPTIRAKGNPQPGF
jgi:hypothetical protein